MKKYYVLTCVLCLGAMVFGGSAFSNARTTDPLGIAVSPQTLLLSQPQGGEVTVHTAIPYGSIVSSSLALNGVAAKYCFADCRGNIVGKFDEDAIEATVAPPSATMVVTGTLRDGTDVAGTDDVRVIL